MQIIKKMCFALFTIGCNPVSEPVQLHLLSSRLLPPRLLRATAPQLFTSRHGDEKDLSVDGGRNDQRVRPETRTETGGVQRQVQEEGEFVFRVFPDTQMWLSDFCDLKI